MMKLGLAQMNTRGDKEQNLAIAEEMVTSLANQGADFVMLPEYFNYMGPEECWLDNAEPMGASPSLERMQKLAVTLGVHLHIGSYMERDGEHVYNTGVVFDPLGQVVARYRKMHLFDVEIPGGRKYLESQWIRPGSEVVTFSVAGCVFGMSTCYDIRFPELYRILEERGAHVFLLPAAFTQATGKDHWELLLRTRAVENLCWVAAAGQYGDCPPNHRSYGRSMVVDPWGSIVAEAQPGVSTVVAEIDLKLLQDIRKRFPVLRHRRDLL